MARKESLRRREVAERGETNHPPILTPEQTIAIAKKLSEPYSTLVLFMAVTGLRIGEAIAIK
jgi:integrase